MSSSFPPPSGGTPQQPGEGRPVPGQGTPYPAAQNGSPYGGQPPQQPAGWQQSNQGSAWSPQPAVGTPANGAQGAQSPHSSGMAGSPNPGSAYHHPAPQFAPAPQGAMPGQFGPASAPKDFVVAWLLALFLGVFGADRFYRGFVGLGILKLLTCGGAGIWALVDLLIIIFTGGKDSKGRPLANYEKNKKLSWIVTGIVVGISLVFSAINGATSAGTDASSADEETVATAELEPEGSEQGIAAEEAVEEKPAEEPAAEEPAAEEKPAEEPAAEKPAADEKPAEEPAAEEPAAEEKPAEEPAVEEAPAPDVPAAQQSMSDAVAEGRTAAESAETDLQRANVLNVRSEAMCASIPDGAVESWVGTVVTVDANGEGKAVVTLSIDEDIEIGTWNNAFSDVSDNTLIEQGTPLYDSALALAPGDTVEFSGTLKSGSESNDECYYASNMTEVMSIDSPDYIMTFTDLQKVE
ncbi:TM2 domain-containing protein [Brachybacterium fresconis]|uniref:Cytoskeletal protein RodZ n=1 Tax=Brachybacterium fresconis TaxID=173363 RepID=A0ABS4YG05_9MICO|nr:TM2 domain-containing protein [Brachybacterium fresconis]MBP2407746.1 cytoskeletal protein RodZ [Brachybacterium fresconis]